MPDFREQILARLVGIAAQVPGVALAGRNRIALSETARPAIIVLDADEAAEEEERASRPGHAPQLVVMTPELFVLAGKPAAEIGAELNTFRRRIIRRVLTDAELLALAGPKTPMTLTPCATIRPSRWRSAGRRRRSSGWPASRRCHAGRMQRTSVSRSA